MIEFSYAERQSNLNGKPDLPHAREEIEFSRSRIKKSNQKKKKCMAPLTLYSSNEKPTPERSRKMRGQLLWCLRGSVCASQNHLTSNCFANSRHCLGRMRYEEEKKRLRERRGAKFCCASRSCTGLLRSSKCAFGDQRDEMGA